MSEGKVPADPAPVSAPRRRMIPTRPWPVHTLLFAAYAVLFLFAENVADVAFEEVLPPLVRALLGALVVLLVASLLLRDLRRGAIIATAIVIAWSAYGHLGGMLAPLEVSRDAQLTLWVVIILIAVVAAFGLRERWVAGLTRGLDVVAGVLVAITSFQIARYVLTRPAPAVASAATPEAEPAPGARDLYYIILDRYGSTAGMEGLGAEPSDLGEWLAARGFIVADAAHANYGRTTMSLAATLNMTTLDDAATKVGPDSDDPTPVYSLIQDHAVGRFLKERGYRYIHIGNWFAPTRTVRLADESLAMPWGSDFEAKLEETTFKPTLDDLMSVTEPPAHHILHRRTALWQFHEFERVRTEPGPKLVILHVLLPHDPYVFDEIGEYPDEQARATRSEGDKYTRQTTYLNDQVRRIVDELLDVPPDEQPIVVIAGDEGPYPTRYSAAKETFDWGTATTTELETKYGILDAFYLPGDAPSGAPAPYPAMSSWNTFRVVLSRYFDADLPLLPDRSFTSAAWKRPYDLTDVTDLLPPPYGQTRA